MGSNVLAWFHSLQMLEHLSSHKPGLLVSQPVDILCSLWEVPWKLQKDFV